ncbi:zinc finger protein [Wuchereria bancrofti]|uniref:Zinc finger protein n=1 Tax=Wuchereria bancrofti TaxID=6293 RepID=J9B2R0_WUCBA|nr:zinc finger protein [Wuchereria bancrofti]
MSALSGQSPGHPMIFDVLDYLKTEPVMLQALQEYITEKEQLESSLLTRLEEAERRLEELEGRNAQNEMEERPVPQEPEFNVEEAEWAPLPESDDEADKWPSGAEWAPLPDDEEDESEVPVAPLEASSITEPEETVRELVLRSRTITIPVLATQKTLAAATPEIFRPADLGNLPDRFRRELQVPQAEPYTVIEVEGENIIVCGICNRQFGTLKGWRIHASRTHKQDGFCARCGHYLLLPPEFTAAQKIAAIEIHALDWCPRACAAVINERQAKRRRLDLVGREEDGHCLFIPGKKYMRNL